VGGGEFGILHLREGQVSVLRLPGSLSDHGLTPPPSQSRPSHENAQTMGEACVDSRPRREPTAHDRRHTVRHLGLGHCPGAAAVTAGAAIGETSGGTETGVTVGAAGEPPWRGALPEAYHALAHDYERRTRRFTGWRELLVRRLAPKRTRSAVQAQRLDVKRSGVRAAEGTWFARFSDATVGRGCRCSDAVPPVAHDD
jgi:hypothetical protein